MDLGSMGSLSGATSGWGSMASIHVTQSTGGAAGELPSVAETHHDQAGAAGDRSGLLASASVGPSAVLMDFNSISAANLNNVNAAQSGSMASLRDQSKDGLPTIAESQQLEVVAKVYQADQEKERFQVCLHLF